MNKISLYIIYLIILSPAYSIGFCASLFIIIQVLLAYLIRGIGNKILLVVIFGYLGDIWFNINTYWVIVYAGFYVYITYFMVYIIGIYNEVYNLINAIRCNYIPINIIILLLILFIMIHLYNLHNINNNIQFYLFISFITIIPYIGNKLLILIWNSNISFIFNLFTYYFTLFFIILAILIYFYFFIEYGFNNNNNNNNNINLVNQYQDVLLNKQDMKVDIVKINYNRVRPLLCGQVTNVLHNKDNFYSLIINIYNYNTSYNISGNIQKLDFTLKIGTRFVIINHNKDIIININNLIFINPIYESVYSSGMKSFDYNYIININNINISNSHYKYLYKNRYKLKLNENELNEFKLINKLLNRK